MTLLIKMKTEHEKTGEYHKKLMKVTLTTLMQPIFVIF